jgi:hypothetical protein
MNFKDVMVQDLAFSTQRGPGPAVLNATKALLYLIPIISTIIGIALITIASLSIKRGGCSALTGTLIFGEGKHRIPRIVILSLCTAGLGLFILPFAIAGTVMKAKGASGQIQPQRADRAPAVTSRKIKEVPPDYLL